VRNKTIASRMDNRKFSFIFIIGVPFRQPAGQADSFSQRRLDRG
jgi:hypothetical protein